MINWNEIETVLLDMDGTLLDLHFDDYFWQIQLPLKWGELNGWDSETAMSKLIPIFQGTRGTLPWYCLDTWSEKHRRRSNAIRKIAVRIREQPSSHLWAERHQIPLRPTHRRSRQRCQQSQY